VKNTFRRRGCFKVLLLQPLHHKMYYRFLSIEYQTYQIYAKTKGITNEQIDMVFKVNKLELLLAIVSELCISTNEG